MRREHLARRQPSPIPMPPHATSAELCAQLADVRAKLQRALDTCARLLADRRMVLG